VNQSLELLALLRSIVVDVTEKPLPDVGLDTPIAELGIDSISVAEIVVRIEEKLGIEIPAVEWLGVRTLREMIDIVERARRLDDGLSRG